MKILLTAIIVAFSLISVMTAENFYDLKAVNIDGDTLDFSKFQGKKLLIVNVASKCGYTPQYADLQRLYDNYKGDNFEIIGFPANNFGSQEPGLDPDIKDFCQKNYGVTFTMMSKISVVQPDMHPVYQWLTSKQKNGKMDSKVLWNFQKYLVNGDGTLHSYALSAVTPLDPSIISWVEGTSDAEENENVNNDFSIYPNPASDVINIKNNSQALSVYSILGTELLRIPIGSETLDISNLQPGIYIIKSGNSISRFIKL
jgi:glutathione peroxidase